MLGLTHEGCECLTCVRERLSLSEAPLLFLLSVTLFPFIQHTVGAGSPVISTSSRSLFPATTVITFLVLAPLVSRWILGGSVRGEDGERGRSLRNEC